MSEVSEILEEIEHYLSVADSLDILKSAPASMAMRRTKALLETHAVIDIDTAKASENGCFSTGAYEESRTIQSELDRLTHIEVVK